MPKISSDTLVGVVAGAFIGWAISYYFYRKGMRKPIPSYAIHPLRVRIVDKTENAVPGLELVHHGIPIDAQNVTAATLYFWNDGQRAIHEADVLKPYFISLDESIQLLNIRFMAVTREVCGFEFGHTPQRGIVFLNFKIMEPQDGAQVQIIYAGDPNAKITIIGTCEGANEPKRKDSSLSVSEKYTRITTMIGSMAVVAYLLLSRSLFDSHQKCLITLFNFPFGQALFVLAYIASLGLVFWLVGLAVRLIPTFIARRKTATQILNKSSTAITE